VPECQIAGRSAVSSSCRNVERVSELRLVVATRLFSVMIGRHDASRRHPGPDHLWQAIQALLPNRPATAAAHASTTVRCWPG
jgi:hypothetical protein